jgi:hypothetical protein
MTHIGEREMTIQETRSGSRSIAAILAAVLMATFWLPTVVTPAQATMPVGQSVVVGAASAVYAPTLM